MNHTPYFFPTLGRLLPEENTFCATFLKERATCLWYLRLFSVACNGQKSNSEF